MSAPGFHQKQSKRPKRFSVATRRKTGAGCERRLFNKLQQPSFRQPGWRRRRDQGRGRSAKIMRTCEDLLYAVRIAVCCMLGDNFQKPILLENLAEMYPLHGRRRRAVPLAPRNLEKYRLGTTHTSRSPASTWLKTQQPKPKSKVSNFAPGTCEHQLVLVPTRVQAPKLRDFGPHKSAGSNPGSTKRRGS